MKQFLRVSTKDKGLDTCISKTLSDMIDWKAKYTIQKDRKSFRATDESTIQFFTIEDNKFVKMSAPEVLVELEEEGYVFE